VRSNETHHLLLTAAAAVVATMMASTSLVVAQGKGPKLIEGVLQIPACTPGEGETNGNTPSTDLNELDFGAVHGGEGTLGFSDCFVTLPPRVLPVEEGPEF